MAFLAAKHERGDEHVSKLCLDKATGNVTSFFASVLRVLDGTVGTDLKEAVEYQTLLLVKLS